MYLWTELRNNRLMNWQTAILVINHVLVNFSTECECEWVSAIGSNNWVGMWWDAAAINPVKRNHHQIVDQTRLSSTAHLIIWWLSAAVSTSRLYCCHHPSACTISTDNGSWSSAVARYSWRLEPSFCPQSQQLAFTNYMTSQGNRQTGYASLGYQLHSHTSA